MGGTEQATSGFAKLPVNLKLAVQSAAPEDRLAMEESALVLHRVLQRVEAAEKAGVTLTQYPGKNAV
jgi:hypothetical protein